MPDYVPAIKGQMGDWIYYVTVMKLGKIGRECRIAEEIHTNPDLDNLIQRALHDRVHKEMVPYLLNESQRFYGAMVVAVYGGDPEFSPVRVDEHELIDDRERDSYGFGLLRFDGSQVYYALDGQHRLKSIQEAIREKPDLGKEEITVIILKHEDTQAGLQRTRRLFSTLNRRAQPTTTGLNIAIDEDDSVAIISRQLAKENELLKKLVLTDINSINSKQLGNSRKNEAYLTTLAAFYDTNQTLLSCYKGGMEIDNKFKQFRKPYSEIDEYYTFIENLWMQFLNKCPDFQPILKGEKLPGSLRKRVDKKGRFVLDSSGKPISGGNVYARPLGQFILADTLKLVSMNGKSLEDALDTIMTSVSTDIDDSPWAGVIWNPENHTIESGGSKRKLATQILAHVLGLKTKVGVRELKQQYRAITGNKKAVLPEQVVWSGNSEPQVHIEGNESDDTEKTDSQVEINGKLFP